MKKQLFLSLLMWLPMVVKASTTDGVTDVRVGGLWYELSSKNIAKVIQYKNNVKYDGDIVIPETIEYDDVTYSVISIEYDAFHDCNCLTSVIIPSSIKFIKGGAFSECI